MEWTSVEDKLPIDNEEYLVINKWNLVFIAHFLPSLNEFAASGITHWMPLPEPPN